MYSYEDRLRAVRLYIKLGKRAALTIRQLGYPTKNALKTWHRESRAAPLLARWLGAPAEVLAGAEGTG
jgi:transposase-like protein